MKTSSIVVIVVAALLGLLLGAAMGDLWWALLLGAVSAVAAWLTVREYERGAPGGIQEWQVADPPAARFLFSDIRSSAIVLSLLLVGPRRRRAASPEETRPFMGVLRTDQRRHDGGATPHDPAGLGQVLDHEAHGREWQAVVLDVDRVALADLRHRAGVLHVDESPLSLEEMYTALLARFHRDPTRDRRQSAAAMRERALVGHAKGERP